MKQGISMLLLAGLIIAGCDGGPNGMVRVTGQIEGEAVTAGSRIGGRVVAVLVEEGQQVKQGDVLARLDDAEARAALAAAEAQLAGAEAMLAKLEAGATPEQLRQAEAAAAAAEAQYRMALKGARNEEIRAAEAALDAARAQWDAAKADYERVQRLYSEEIATQRQLEQAKAAVDMAEGQHRSTRETRDMVARGAREEEIAAAKALYDRAAAVVDELKAGARAEDLAASRAARDAAAADRDRAMTVLGEMAVTAPLDSVVESVNVRVGDLVRPGPVVRLVDPDDLRLMVYVSAAMLGKLKVGQQARITTDSHGEESFSGKITHIASQGEYTPRNLQTEEERVQQVFAVKIQLDSAGGKLRAGMSATAHLPKNGGAH